MANTPANVIIHHKNEKGLEDFLIAACIYTTFFAAYFRTSFIGYGFALVLIMFRLHRLRLTPLQVFSIALFIAYLAITLINSQSVGVILQNMRFWYGFVIYVLFFKVCNDSRVATPHFYYFVCATIILEAVLINTVINPELFYGFCNPTASKIDVVQFFSVSYVRPWSFTGNSTMSVGALIVLYAIVERLNPGKLHFRDLCLLLGCVIVIMSATGFLLFLLMLLIRTLYAKFSSFRRLLTWGTTLAAIIGAYFVSTMIKAEDFQKGSFEYISQLFYLKTNGLFLLTTMEIPLIAYLLGLQISSASSNTSGDFGWLLFISTCGITGVAIFALLVYSFFLPGRNMLLILFLLLIGVVHYPIAMSQAGQLLLAFILVGGTTGKRSLETT